MKLWMIAVRALFAYIYLLVILRVSGKRTVGQATALDFVVALILGDVVDDMLWADVPAAMFVVATTSIIASHLVMKILCLHNPAVFRLVEGQPTRVLADGTTDTGGLAVERLSLPSLHGLLRSLGIRDPREARLLNIEIGGDPGLFYTEWAKPATREDWRNRDQEQES